MKSKIRQYIDKNKMLHDESTVIVGFSGGADSVVLLHMLHVLGYNCIAAHCNFHLRGAESDRDEQFASQFASSLDVPFRKIDFDTTAYSEKNGISIEMAARSLRYEWFEQLLKKEKADAVAIAHHKDDSLETLLINLIRGTGLKGLTGIKPVNGHIIRPLLCLSKNEVLEYIQKQQLDFVTDSTNSEDHFVRNKIRLQIVPILETINPSFSLGIAETIKNLTEAEKIYDQTIKKNISSCFNKKKQIINIPLLLKTPSPESVIFEILKNYGFGRDIILDIFEAVNSQSGKEFFSDNFRIIKDRDVFILTQTDTVIDKTKEYLIDKTIKIISSPIQLEITNIKYSPDFSISKEKNHAYFDADKLAFPLTLRRWEAGDRFIPFGMKGSKKLSDYFSDHKFSLIDKENTWVLCSKNEICWIVGHRIDQRFCIDLTTNNVCFMKLL